MQPPGQGKFGKRDTKAESPVQFFLGMAVARRNLFALLFLALPVILVESMAARALFLNPVARDRHMLIALGVSLINGWMLSAVGMLVVQRLQGRPGSLLQLSARAFQYLPKIFVSYVTLLALVGASLLASPLVLFLPLFLWAPMYCIAETFAPTPEPPALPEDDEDEEAFAEIERVFQVWKRSQFTGKRIWDLGFVRSVRFASRNPVLSFQIAALFLLVSFGPSAAVAALMGPARGVELSVVQVVVSSICDVFALCVWAGSFMFTLKANDLKEIQMASDGVSAFVFPRPAWISKLRPVVGALLLAALIGLSTLSWMSLQHSSALERVMPQSAQVSLISVQPAERGLVMEIAFTDEVEQLRWFDPDLLRVQYTKTDADNKVESQLILPERLRLQDVSGRELEPAYFKPAKLVHVRMVAPRLKDFAAQELKVIYLNPLRGGKSRVLVYAKISPKK